MYIHVHVYVPFSVLQLCVPALVHLEWPRDVKERHSLLPLTDQSDIRKLLLQFLLLYLLLPYRSVLQNPIRSYIHTSYTHTFILHTLMYSYLIHSYLHTLISCTYTTRSLEVKAGQLPPSGLNRTLIAKVTGGTTPSQEQLEQRKIAIVKLLSSEVIAAEEVICSLIVAAGDAKSR